METTKMTQHEQGLTSGNVECAVSVWTWHNPEPDQSNTRLICQQYKKKGGWEGVLQKMAAEYTTAVMMKKIFLEQALLFVNISDQE